MRRLGCYIFLAFIIVACVHKKVENIGGAKGMAIPREKLITIITEIQLVESALYLRQSQGSKVSYFSDYYYETVFRKHGISKADFNASMKYYQDRPTELDSLYSAVIMNLSKLQSEKGGVKQPGKVKPVSQED
jgi:hypothetical protein